jgi:hypothetical protein
MRALSLPGGAHSTRPPPPLFARRPTGARLCRVGSLPAARTPLPLPPHATKLDPSLSLLSFLSPSARAAFPLLPRGAAPSSPRPHRSRARLGRYRAAGAVHVAPTAASASPVRAAALRVAEPCCRHGAKPPRHLLSMPRLSEAPPPPRPCPTDSPCPPGALAVAVAASRHPAHRW